MSTPSNNWIEKAACANVVTSPEDDIFFETDLNAAKEMCVTCPVQKDCLIFALVTKQVNGVWGGVDEGELRRVQSLGADGKRHDHVRQIRCPSCGPNSTKYLEVVEYHRTKTDIRCSNCNLEWVTKKIIRKRPPLNW